MRFSIGNHLRKFNRARQFQTFLDLLYASFVMTEEYAPREEISLILVVGVTGSGKSYFVNRIAGLNSVKESSGLEPCTRVCEIVISTIGKTKVMIVDTPGFDDTRRGNSEILEEILKVLTYQYKNKTYISLKGVVYLHRITDMRFAGSSMETLKIFTKICGESALSNVILATTRWDEVDPVLGAAREEELRTKFWQYMLQNNSKMVRFYGSTDSAEGMVSLLINKPNIVFDIQREVVDENKATSETGAGSVIRDQLLECQAETEEIMHDLTLHKQKLKASDRMNHRQVQEDIVEQQEYLQKLHKGQKILEKRVAVEVDEKIQARQRRWTHTGGENIPVLLPIFELFGMFANFSKGCKETLKAWFNASGYNESIDEDVLD